MKAHLLVPLFAALVLTGTARSETSGQPRPDGPPPGGPMAERLKHKIEELRREGKNEEAERLERHAREMFAQHRGNPQGEHREGASGGSPGANQGERAAHLSEAAKHLNAAGIHVSPEMLEKLGRHFEGKKHERPHFSPGAQGSSGQHPGGMPGHQGVSPQGGPGPGAGSPMEAMHNEIRTLARQVQELRAMIQQQHGGMPNRGQHEPAKAGEQQHRVERNQAEQHGDRPGSPGASGGNREHHEGAPQPQGDHRPRGEARPVNPPVNGNATRPGGFPPVPPQEG